MDNVCNSCNTAFLLSCHICDATRDSFAKRALHTWNCHPTLCIACQQPYKSPASAYTHSLACFQKPPFNSRRFAHVSKILFRDNGNIVLPCSQCPYFFRNVAEFVYHCLTNHHFQSCHLCEAFFPDTEKLRKHVLCKHILNLICAVCGANFLTATARGIHTFEKHGDRFCFICQLDCGDLLPCHSVSAAHVPLCFNGMLLEAKSHFLAFSSCRDCKTVYRNDRRVRVPCCSLTVQNRKL